MDLKNWALDTAVRAVKTFAQTLVALFGADAFNVLHGVDWTTDLGIAAGAGLVSVLHNVATLNGPKADALPATPVPDSVASQPVAVEPVAPAVPAAPVDLGVTPAVHPVDAVTPAVTPEVLPSVLGS